MAQPIPPPPAIPQAPQPTPKKGMSTAVKVLIAFGVLFVLGLGGCVALIGAAGNAVSEGIEEVADERQADEALVEDSSTITNCEVGEFGTAVATVEFTNPLPEEKGYISIEINFLEGDTVVGSGSAVFENLSPGQKAVGEATAFDLVEGVTSVTCEVVDGSVL